MIISKIQRDSNGEFFLEIPESEVNRLKIATGDTIRMDLKRVPMPWENPEAFRRLVDQEYTGTREMLEDLKHR